MSTTTRTINVIIATLAVIATLLTGFQARPAQAQAVEPAAGETTTLLIQFNPQANDDERNALFASLDAEIVHWLPQIGVVEVRVPAAKAQQRASFDSQVVNFAELDAVVTGAPIFDDPALTDPDQGYGLQKIEAPIAWLLSTGIPTVTVAIADTGINAAHPEFAGRLVPGYDFINEDDDPTDDHGHGTHVAGIVAAAGDGVGTIGVCPRCTVMAVKVLNANNAGTWSGVARGILFAVDNGAKVINLSLGSANSSATLESAIAYARTNGVVVVAAAGNAGTNAPYYPAVLEGVLGVGATDADDAHWSLSNYGPNADLVAPGVRIYSTYHDLNRNGGYVYMTGTSMAAPYVSGVAGLLLSFNPNLTAAEVMAIIMANADDLGDAGPDTIFGNGRLNAHRALVAANGGIEPRGGNDEDRQVVLYLPVVTK